MSDSLLNILKFALLALLYLFFARVLWAVWSEVRQPRAGAAPAQVQPRVVAVPAPAKPPRASRRARKGVVSRLIVLEPRANRGTAISLANEITFGRAAGCTVSVPDDTFVSQVHARAVVDQGRAIVEDLGSTNGTFVNGNRISAPAILSPGDRIQIGSTVLEAG